MGAKTSAQVAALQGDGLPKGWNVIRFGQIAQIANGQIDPRAAPYRSMVHVGPENIESGTGHIRAKRTAGELGMISGKYLFDEHAIVYSKVRPNLNKACIPGFRGVCSADAYPIWVQDSAVVERNFLFHYMLSELFLRQTVAASLRTGMPKINRPDLASVRVVLPPREEQQAIAAFLDNMDRACALIRRVIPRKRRRLRGLMQQLLTGRRRLPAFVDQPWEEVHLGDVFVERDETSRADLPLLSITADRGVIPRTEVDRKDTSNADKSKYIRIAPGDIGYNTMRMWQGVSALSSLEGIVSPAYTIATPTDRIDARYAAWLFKLPRMIHSFYRYSQGLVNDTLQLKYENFSEVKTRIPRSVVEQIAIADVLDTAQKEIDLLVALREQIQQQKRGLMQKQLTGQVRVSDTVTSVEAV